MAFSGALAERICQRLARRKGIEQKKMFGGIGFLLNGNLGLGVWKDSLIVRVGPEQWPYLPEGWPKTLSDNARA